MSCDETSDDELLLLLAEEDDAEDERQEAAVNFCFTREQADVLTRLLRLPDTFRTSSRHTASGTQALCILLRRLAYLNRLSDMQKLFGRDETVISIIGKGVLEHAYSKSAHLLDFDCSRLTPLKFQAFAGAVNQKGAPLRCCVDFVSGTIRGVCRPSEIQQFVYSGHKVLLSGQINRSKRIG